MPQVHCPPANDLQRLFLGGGPEEEVDALERHLLDCGCCLETLKTLLGERETLAALLRGWKPADSGSPDPVAQELREKLLCLRTSPGNALLQGTPMLPLACPSCHKKLSVKETLAGKKIKCPGCGQVIAVPARVASSVGNVDQRHAPAEPAGVGGKPEQPPVDTSTTATPSPLSQLEATHDNKSPHSSHPSNLTDFLAPAQTDDELGRLGKYRILSILGHGGMGVVFKAEDPKLKRLVALKAMLPALAASASAGERFLREAQAMAAVENDHVVTIFQVDEERGVPFLAMEFLKGEPLDERLRREEKLPLAEVLRIGREIARALDAAHKTGLIHRDVKPGNIWLEAPESRVKILDFGLARAAVQDASLTQQGAIVGTPAYMAPEQGRGDAVDARCDLFSLGVVLYRLCCGQQPFQGKDTVSTLLAVATHQPAPPISLNPELPPELSDLVMQLLEKNPEERPESARMVEETLQEFEGRVGAMMAPPGRMTGKEKRAGTSRMEATRTAAGQSAKRRIPLPWLVGSGVLGLGVVAAAIILFWPTPHGTVRIESDDPSVEIVFDKNGPTIKGADKEPIMLRAGEHGVLIKRGDFSFGTDKFVLKKGQAITLKLEWLPGKVQVVQDGKVMASHAIQLPATFKNSLGMEFVLVPRGKFLMGGGGGTVGNKEVVIPHDFYLGKYEVTQGEWEAIMGVNPSHFQRTGVGRNEVANTANEDLKRFPVELVSWEDAQIYLTRVNERAKETGWVYRLPKETEWEYACRGGELANKLDYGFDFYLEKPSNLLLPEQANFAHEKGMKRTCKVGSYKPNALGLYDMHGNVWEWCDDAEKPADPASQRVDRGGGWYDGSGICRAAHRDADAPSHRNSNLGLRLARVPVGKEPVVPKLPEVAVKPPKATISDAWMKEVASMPAEKQVEAVAAKLKDLNPGFDGVVTPTIEWGVVTGLQVITDNVTDISPVRALTGLQALNCSASGKVKFSDLSDLSPLKSMKLTGLSCDHTQVSDLSPLKDMKLMQLSCYNTKVADFSPLKNMKLTWLECRGAPVSDLSPLKDMKLNRLGCSATKVSDLTPLKSMKLTGLSCSGTNVSDLSPLKDMKLTDLHFTSSGVTDLSPLKNMPLIVLSCDDTKVADLSPLKDMKLTQLWCNVTPVSDLSPLKGMPLIDIRCDFKPHRDTEILRSIQTLETINGKTAKEFWKEVESKQAAFAAWMKEVAALPAEKQVAAVSARLKELNPEFDGKVTPKIEGGVVTQLELLPLKVTDISPVRAMEGLRVLDVGCTAGKGQLADLWPLKGMQLTGLDCNHTQVSDLRPLMDMKLTTLHCNGTLVNDLSPLKNMPLKVLSCDFKPERDAEILRAIKTLEKINGKPAGDFWKDIDDKKPDRKP